MNGITILIWITIAIIAIIAIIAVKLHFKGDELEKEEGSILDGESINKVVNAGQNILSKNDSQSPKNHSAQLYPDNRQPRKEPSFNKIYEEPAVVEVENSNNYKNVEYKSQNQVLVDYGNTVEKFQEPIKQSQMDIMTQNNNPTTEKHELKDLFTIDELIKESKRKDSEREKEIVNHDDDKEITELKESIKQRKEKQIEDVLIEEIIDENEETIKEVIGEDTDKPEENKKEETINDLIKDDTEVQETESEETINDLIKDDTEVQETESEETINDLIKDDTEAEENESVQTELETSTVTSQDIEEAINTASKESEEEVESISESSGITDVLLDATENETPEEEIIKEPILKTPAKVDERKKDYKFGADLNDDNVFGEYDNDLDYRKDIAKITNTIKGSKIFQDVKDKLKLEQEDPVEINDNFEEKYIRNVTDYEDEFAPIINETHADFEATYEEYHSADFDQRLRQQNTKKVFDIVKNSPEPAESRIGAIKDKPARENIKIEINNNEFVVKPGDEIIFNHDGETYSSQVYAINGDEISVKYRRQNITIKASDVKKVY